MFIGKMPYKILWDLHVSTEIGYCGHANVSQIQNGFMMINDMIDIDVSPQLQMHNDDHKAT